MRHRHLITIAVALCVLLLLLFSSVTAAQEPEGEAATVSDIAGELYCPLCTGQTVEACPLEVCEDMRQDIAGQLDEGRTPEEIKAYFVEQYGQQVLGRPATRGFDLIAWLLPFLVLLVTGVAVVAWLRSRSTPVLSSPAAPNAASDSEPDEYSARLERELQRLDE